MRTVKNKLTKGRVYIGSLTKMKKSKNIFKAAVALIVVAAIVAVGYFGSLSILKTLYPLSYNNFVEIYSQRNNLNESFVYAVIKCESGFDKDAVSHMDAKGLMQIMPETFTWLKTKTNEELGEDMLFDPETSIKYGCLLYGILKKEFKSDEAVVAAYHAGSGNVSKWLKNEKYSSDGVHLKDIPFSSTKQYVEKVLKAEDMYKKLYKID